MRKPNLLALLALFLVFPLMCGCGGGSAASTGTNPRPTISVAIAEEAVSLGAGESYQFVAAVTGTSNTSVTWSLSGCAGANCGTISNTGLYTAPSVVPTEAVVTLTATSQAVSTKFDTVAVHHMPISVSIAPSGVWIVPGRTIDFTAAIHYDVSHNGVTWAVGAGCSPGCGTLSKVTKDSVTYTAPAEVPDPATVKLTATSVNDTSKIAEVSITVALSRGLVEGGYAFSFYGWEIHIDGQGYYTPSSVATAGHFYADAHGNIAGGIEDVNLLSGVSQLTFTGTYIIGADGRGSLTFTSTQGSTTYHLAIDSSGRKGRFIKFDGLPVHAPVSGSGYFELQDKAVFSLSDLAGPYATGMFGTSQEFNRLATVGRFDADAAGTFSGGTMDVTLQTHAGVDPQRNFTNLTLTGSLSLPYPGTGRGTAALTLSPAPSPLAGHLNFAYYVISSEKILLVQTDQRTSNMPALSGQLRRQNGRFSAASVNGPSIFSMTGVNRANYGAEIVTPALGQMVPDGSGSMTGTIDGTLDDSQHQRVTNLAFTGSYSVASNGRCTMALQFGPGNADKGTAYFFGQNEAFLMQTSGTDVLFGSIKPQAAGPFTAASISDNYLTATPMPTSEQAENDIGLTTFDGASGITASVDVDNHFLNLHHFDFVGTYTVAANGRGTLTFLPPSNGSAVFWLISPTELVAIGRVDATSPWSSLLKYEK